ncbi:MAG TPA: Hsp20/alpha crystallin family protein [Terriglobia bacterium]|nr:Hsp20/alpha crystallin family protein [Terriglobia bacterium]
MSLTILNRMLSERDWNGPGQSGRTIAATEWSPPVDIFETESEIVIKMELPGVASKAISVNVDADVLTIRGERHHERDLKTETYHRMECSNGRFLRSFSLPGTVDADQLHSNYIDGMLTLTLPKK